MPVLNLCEEAAAGCIFLERLSVRKQKFKFSEYQPFLSRAQGAWCPAWLVLGSGLRLGVENNEN